MQGQSIAVSPHARTVPVMEHESDEMTMKALPVPTNPPRWVDICRSAWLAAASEIAQADDACVRLDDSEEVMRHRGEVWPLATVWSISEEPRMGTTLGISGHLWSQRFADGNSGVALEIVAQFGDSVLISMTTVRIHDGGLSRTGDVARNVASAVDNAARYLLTDDPSALQDWALGDDPILRRVAATSQHCPDFAKVAARLTEMKENTRWQDAIALGVSPTRESLQRALLSFFLFHAQVSGT